MICQAPPKIFWPFSVCFGTLYGIQEGPSGSSDTRTEEELCILRQGQKDGRMQRTQLVSCQEH